MRELVKNKKTFYAVNYLRTEDVIDEEGNLTGERIVKYSRAYKIQANLSGAKGSVEAEVFGTDIKYDKTFTITTTDFNRLKITENTVFFIDKKPEYKDSLPIYNYRVKKIAEAINDVVVAIEKV